MPNYAPSFLKIGQKLRIERTDPLLGRTDLGRKNPRRTDPLLVSAANNLTYDRPWSEISHQIKMASSI